MATKMKKGIMDDQQFCFSVIENALDGIAVLDGSKCVYANKRFSETLGYEETTKVIGKSLRAFVYPEDKEKIKQMTRKKNRWRTHTLHIFCKIQAQRRCNNKCRGLRH